MAVYQCYVSATQFFSVFVEADSEEEARDIVTNEYDHKSVVMENIQEFGLDEFLVGDVEYDGESKDEEEDEEKRLTRLV